MIDVLKKLRRVWYARIIYRELAELYPNGAENVHELHMYSGIPTMYVEKGLNELKRLGLAEQQPVTGWFLTNQSPRAVKVEKVGRTYELKPPAEAPKKKRKGKNPEIEQTNNNHALFIAQWVTTYEQKFGRKYIFNGKDGRAAKMALESGMAPEDLMKLATEAWDIGEKKPYIYVLRNSIDLMNFATTLNQIQAELAKQQPKPVTPVTPVTPAAAVIEPVLQLPGHKYSYTRSIGPALEDWAGHPDAESEFQMAERTWRQWCATQK
jgi:DNA-binding IscR family transcriptional regulator